MPELFAPTALAWDEGSTIFGSPVALVWEEGSRLWSEGGTYTPPAPPGGGTPATPSTDPRFKIDAAAAYSVVHTMSVIDLRDGQPVEVDSVNITTDEDSLFWSVSMSGGPALYDKLRAGIQPASVEVTIDGQAWRFIIDNVVRQRRFASWDVRAQGRSLTSAAGAPYEFEQPWSLVGDTTAAQIAASAISTTGLALEWTLPDWPVPEGVWSHTGTPLGVVKRVAESVDAIAQSDPKEYVVRVLPRYPLLPNEWATVPPDFEVALDALESEGFDRTDKPAYDGIYVMGQQGGASAFVRLAGTSGSNLKPMVTDALLTDVAACTQRGMAELGRSGEQQRHTISLPFLAGVGQPGAMRVGWLGRVVEPTETWHGLVRSVSIQAQLPTVNQTVVLERHLTPIPGTVYDPNLATPLRFVGPVPTQTVATGAAFSLNLATFFADGEPPYTFSRRSGTLPSWLSLSSAGMLTGTAPGSSESTTLAFRATDDINSTADTNEFAINVAAAGVHLTVLTLAGYGVQADSVTGSWTTGAAAGTDNPKRAVYDGTTLVVQGAQGTYWSTNKGSTWTQGSDIAQTGDNVIVPLLVKTASEYVVPFLFDVGPMDYRHLVSSDGQTWTTRAATTPPSSFLLPYVQRAWHNAGTIYASFYAAGSEGTPYDQVWSSTDGGLTWGAFYNEDLAVFGVASMLFGGGTILMVSDLGDVKTSTNSGVTWVDRTLPYTASANVGLYADGRFVLTPGSGYFMRSSDGGASWSTADVTGIVPAGYVFKDLIWDGTQYVALLSNAASGSGFLTSPDAATWTWHAGPSFATDNVELLVATP